MSKLLFIVQERQRTRATFEHGEEAPRAIAKTEKRAAESAKLKALFLEDEAAEQTKNFLSIFLWLPPRPRRKAEKERKEIFGFAARAERALRDASAVPLKMSSCKV